MNNFKVIFFLLYFISVTFSCNEVDTKTVESNIPPPPEIPFEERCNKQKRKAYALLKEGIVRIIFNDSFRTATGTQLMSEVLESKFNLTYCRIYDTILDKECIIPIMDSVIAKRFGKNGKDSIIDITYRLTDSIYDAKIRKGELNPRDYYQ